METIGRRGWLTAAASVAALAIGGVLVTTPRQAASVLPAGDPCPSGGSAVDGAGRETCFTFRLDGRPISPERYEALPAAWRARQSFANGPIVHVFTSESAYRAGVARFMATAPWPEGKPRAPGP